MKIKLDITKQLLVRMAMFVAVIGAAILLDVYFDNNAAELENIQAESRQQATETSAVYLIAQTGSTSIKTSTEKSLIRELQVQSHDKFLRKYHQIRNYQLLKAEVKTQTVPLIQSYHYLVFQHFSFTQPDEDSLA